MALAVMLNNLLHDFSVALLMACLLLMWILGRPDFRVGLPVLRRIYGALKPVTVACWIVIVVGGVVRTLAYREYEWLPAAGRGQLAALAVKHLILVSLVAVGIWAQRKLNRKLH